MRTSLWLLMLFAGLVVQAGDEKPLIQQVKIGIQVFKLEVAHTPATRAKGLMGREKVPYGEGMIFVFPDEEKRSFWMCNTLVDLDILYLDATGTVVDIQTMTAEAPRRRLETVPEYEERLTRYPSKAPAQFAVELCVGGADLAGVAVGDRIELDLKALNALVADERND